MAYLHHSLAGRLVDNILQAASSVNVLTVADLQYFAAGKLVGDVLLAASFVSYAGPFSMPFRKDLVTEKWLPDLVQRGIPMTAGVMPLHTLADDTKKVQTPSYPCCAIKCPASPRLLS